MNYFDLHCDTATHIFDCRETLHASKGHVSVKKASAIDSWVQVYAIFIDDTKRKKDAFLYYLAVKDNLLTEMAKKRNDFIQCRSAEDLQRVKSTGCRGAILSVENGAVLGGDARRLHQLEQDGVKLFTFTWYGENELGFGSAVGGAMKPFGLEVLRLLPQYGILPDISHLSDEGVEQVFTQYDGTLVASHSNVRSVTPHYRSLTDAQIKEIIRRKGLIGTNLYEHFLSEKENACMDDVYRHIDAFLSLGAEHTLCFGCDFDGGNVPAEIADISGIPQLYEYLLHRGIGESTLADIFYNNAYHFWERELAKT